MLAETEWRGIGPAPSPAKDGVLSEDWGASSGAWTRRHAFLDLAAAGYRLELEPTRRASVELRVRRISGATG